MNNNNGDYHKRVFFFSVCEWDARTRKKKIKTTNTKINKIIWIKHCNKFIYGIQYPVTYSIFTWLLTSGIISNKPATQEDWCALERCVMYLWTVAIC